MDSLEVHIITDEFDSDRAFTAGLLDEPFSIDVCANCADDVGSLAKFKPYVYVLAEDDASWVVCIECALPVTDPGEDDINDEEFDEDELDDVDGDDDYELLDFDK
jgi:hypothetical protein